MATFQAVTSDTYVKKLAKLTDPEMTKKAVYAGAEVMADEIRGSLQKTLSGNSTGDLERSLGIAPISTDKDGNTSTKIGFAGYDQNKTPNALKARALDSGTSTQRKTRFLSKAVKSAKERASRAMEESIDKSIESIMK